MTPTEVMKGGRTDASTLAVGDEVISRVGPPGTYRIFVSRSRTTVPSPCQISAPFKRLARPRVIEASINALYVPKIYTHLTVTVKTTSDRVYFVRGEVNHLAGWCMSGQLQSPRPSLRRVTSPICQSPPYLFDSRQWQTLQAGLRPDSAGIFLIRRCSPVTRSG